MFHLVNWVYTEKVLLFSQSGFNIILGIEKMLICDKYFRCKKDCLQVETKFLKIGLFVEEITLLEVKWPFEAKIVPFLEKK